jgi:prevent-host-death family protein
VSKSEPRKLKVTWKITPLTAENDPHGSLRERQLQVIRRLLIRASEETKAENLTGTVDRPSSASRSERGLMLHCSPMATEVPQRQLRNDTASLLRRVEAGEHLRITVHGHPVAELVPVDRTHPFVPFDELVSELHGTMLSDDHLDSELREFDEIPRDPFA